MKKMVATFMTLSAASLAVAQSSVTIYGVVDNSYSVNKGSVADVSGIAWGNLSSSRIGFRGVEDLGDGLKASFNLEAGIGSESGQGVDGPSLDNVSAAVGAGGLTFGRRATVSLSGSFGEIRIGRDFVPTYYNENQFAPLGRNGAGSSIITQVNVVGATRSRTSNGIKYLLPKLGGFYGEAMFAFGEQPDNAGTPAGSLEDNGNYLGARLGYAAGPFDMAFSAGKTSIARNITAPVTAAAAGNDRLVYNLGMTYNLGVVKLFGLYSLQSQENTVGSPASGLNLAGLYASAGNDLEARALSVGATIPSGRHEFKFGFSTLKLENGQGLGTTPTAEKFALGYQYNFSKRTAFYASYARLKNKDSAPNAGLAAGLTAGANRQRGLASTALTGPSASSTAFDLGIRHSF